MVSGRSDIVAHIVKVWVSAIAAALFLCFAASGKPKGGSEQPRLSAEQIEVYKAFIAYYSPTIMYAHISDRTFPLSPEEVHPCARGIRFLSPGGQAHVHALRDEILGQNTHFKLVPQHSTLNFIILIIVERDDSQLSCSGCCSSSQPVRLWESQHRRKPLAARIRV